MKHLSSEEKYLDFEKYIVRPRKDLIRVICLFPVFVFLSIGLFGERLLPLIGGVFFLVVLGLGVRVMAHDNCPWCRSSFYWRDGRSRGFLKVINTTQCANCGMPSVDDAI